MLALQIAILIAQMHATWPAYPHGQIATIAMMSVLTSHGSQIPAEVFAVIAQHESDMRPDAVSYVDGSSADVAHPRGRRRDVLLLDGGRHDLPGHVVCGYLQARLSDVDCRAAVGVDGGMALGAAELAEWTGTCRGIAQGSGASAHASLVACVMRGHAGGTACARDVARCTADQRAFADYFVAGARALRRVLPARAGSR